METVTAAIAMAMATGKKEVTTLRMVRLKTLMLKARTARE